MTTSPDSVTYPTVGYGLAVALDEGTGSYNFATLAESGAGLPVQILAQGEDANIDIELAPKGTGTVRFNIGSIGTLSIGIDKADYVTIAGAANTGVVDTQSPTITALGAASTLDMKVLGKGTGGRLNSTKLYIGPSSVRSVVDDLNTVYFRTSTTFVGPIVPALRIGGDFSGTHSSTSNPYHQIAIDSDNVNAAGRGSSGFGIGHTVSAGARGGRTAFGAFLNIGGTITADSSGAGSFYTAGAAFSQSSASAGGIAGVGNARGNLFGFNASARLLSGAGLYWSSVVGGEVNVGIPTGTQAEYKVGWQIVQWGDDTVRGSQNIDSGLVFTAQPSAAVIGWDRVITIGHPFGHWPAASTATLIGTATSYAGGPSYAAAWGIDFSAVTFSSGFLKSAGFQVDGNGNTTAASLIFGAGPRIVTGSGAPSVLLALAKGSIYIRTDGGVGSTIYVTQGAGTWNAIAGV